MADERIKLVTGDTDSLIKDAIEYFDKNDRPKLMFSATSGEIAEFNSDIFFDISSDWFAIFDKTYPVYENGVFTGYLINGRMSEPLIENTEE